MLDRLELMLDKKIIDTFKTTNVFIIGIGGVGGYALECLVRSGFENITIVDKDIVDKTNLNRQIISLNSNIGKSKVDIAKKRCLDINPKCNINEINEFILENNINELNLDKYDYIIDACDTLTTKVLLIDYCTKNNLKLVSCMGTGNRLDSTKLEITKLSKTNNDPLAKNIRRILKEKEIKANPVVVSSLELPIKTHNRIPGSMVVVPMQAGNLCASYIINDIIKRTI